MPTLLHITTVPLSLRFLWGQISYMRAAGYEVHAVSSPGPLLDELVAREGAIVHAVPMQRAIAPGADLLALGRLVALFKAIRPDIVHAHTPKGGLLGTMAAALAGVPVRIYQLHGLPLSTATGARRLVLGLTERVAAGLSSRTLAVSPSLAREARALRLVSPSKLEVLLDGSCNGVDAHGRFRPSDAPGRQAEARASLGVPADGVLLGFVGRLVRDKGLTELSAAFRALSAERPDVRLLLVGPEEAGDPVPPDALRALLEHPRVHRLELTEQMPTVYEALDVLVLPTYREGLPTVLLEAAAMQRPVVATSVTGCVDVVAHEQTGLLVAPHDADALRAALLRYVDDAALRRAHGLAARAHVIDRFDQARLWEALEATYRALLASPR